MDAPDPGSHADDGHPAHVESAIVAILNRETDREFGGLADPARAFPEYADRVWIEAGQSVSWSPDGKTLAAQSTHTQLILSHAGD